MSVAVRKLAKSETSHVMRISGENFERIKQLKLAFGRKNGLKKVTYDTMLGQALDIARMLIEGDEWYGVGERLFRDLADARGEAIRAAVRAKVAPRMPMVLLKLGEDKGPAA